MPKRSGKEPTKGRMEEEVHKIIANYMKASTALETYLHSNGVLTPLQEQSVYTTLKMTQTLFDGWRPRNRGTKT